ncbi:MAG: aconitate hydratase [Porticoccaceae bacterium]|jgi:aconitate hydratase
MNSFDSKQSLLIGSDKVQIQSLAALLPHYPVDTLPYSLKVLLENLLRHEDGRNVTRAHIEALANWQPDAQPDTQIAFSPSRVILQDFTGVPAIVDLAAMRDAMKSLGADPSLINPQIPVDLVIDHSVMVDHYASLDAQDLNRKLEFSRNRERYEFLRWGQQAFSKFRVVPPGTGIVHQVNLEYLADVVTVGNPDETDNNVLLYPDTLVGTDSHTTMINALGVLGWGVGGIEAEAAMLGQPITMLVPQVVGFRLHGSLPAGATATDLVLTVTQMLRAHGVVGKFVDFHGDGLSELSLADRATISNMSPEFGATCAMFPIDSETIRYLSLTGRTDAHVERVEAYARAQGMWRSDGDQPARYSDALELDLAIVEPSIAGPKRPQDRIALNEASQCFSEYLIEAGQLEKTPSENDQQAVFDSEGGQSALCNDQTPKMRSVPFDLDGTTHELHDGDVVIAAITSCTNTSNPAVMMAAGLLARNARARGLVTKPWVKTSLAPGSQVVPQYLEAAGVLEPLRELGFHVVGFGCTTCIGNSGPLDESISKAIKEGNLIATAVLSGNRNFEGRIHQEVRANYLASPPLVVAYALAGSLRIDIVNESLGNDADGKPVFLHEIWPTTTSINEAIQRHVSPALFKQGYENVFEGADEWKALQPPQGDTYAWPKSTYIRQPPFFEDISATPEAQGPITNARCLVMVGDSITTDHISPAGAIHPYSPAGTYLQSLGVSPGDFNSLGSRRGNHEVMMRGTFANVRFKNQLAPGTEGSATRHLPDGDKMSIYDAGMRYQHENVPLIILAGREYGTGSSRDWAAKGTRLLGVRAVMAQSYERIHRSNLIGFGVLPLQFVEGENVKVLGLNGEETFSIDSVSERPEMIQVHATNHSGKVTDFIVKVRIETPVEWDYFEHGGILHFVLRKLAAT